CSLRPPGKSSDGCASAGLAWCCLTGSTGRSFTTGEDVMGKTGAVALESLPDLRLAVDRAARADSRTWAIVLAGGEGYRLRPLVQRLFGEDRPKQYVPLLGPSSLLKQTLERVGRLVPPERTLVVSQYDHSRYLDRELCDVAAPHVLLQPENRGTGTAVLFAAHTIRRLDPEAVVAVFPSDHSIREGAGFPPHSSGGAAFPASVSGVSPFFERHPERLVLLGARPTAPEPEYGWVRPGTPLGET